DSKVRVGVVEFALKLAGMIEFVDLPFEGDEFSQDEIFGTVESAKWVGQLPMPLSGRILKINEELEETPSILNEDPYGRGWMVLVKPKNLERELSNLLSQPEEIEDFLRGEIRKHMKK
ncbi:MAG: glycine cleavage system protein H, partial [Candidatus Methanofastidiosia archaeon]